MRSDCSNGGDVALKFGYGCHIACAGAPEPERGVIIVHDRDRLIDGKNALSLLTPLRVGCGQRCISAISGDPSKLGVIRPLARFPISMRAN